MSDLGLTTRRMTASVLATLLLHAGGHGAVGQESGAEILWTYRAGGRITGAPAIAEDGTVYAGALDGKLYAIDLRGAEQWVFDYAEHTTNGFGAQAFHGAPALDDDGTIYIGDDIAVPNFFFAVLPDGQPRWVYETWGVYSQIDTSPALDRRGRVYAGMWGAGGRGGPYGNPIVLDDRGQRLDSNRAAGPVVASPAVLDDDRVVFAASSYVEVGYFPLWLYLPFLGVPRAGGQGGMLGHPGRLGSSPAQVGIGTRQRPARFHVYADDPLKPEIHRITTVHGPSSLAVDGQVVWLGVTSPGPALRAYDFSPQGQDTGGHGDRSPRPLGTTAAAPRLLRTLPLDAPVAGSSLLGRRRDGALEVVALQTDGTLLSYDVPDDPERAPTLRWRKALGASASAAPALGADGLVYAGVDSWVIALSREHGAIAWRSPPLGASITSAIALGERGRVLAGADNGLLVAISGAEGGLDRDAVWPSYRHDRRNTGAVPLGR